MKTFILINFVLISAICFSQPSNKFEARDVFDLEYASDPRIEPDGERIIYVRNYKDVMTDANLSNLWMVIAGKGDDPTMHLPVTTGKQNDSSPRWSNDGSELIYISGRDGSTQIYRRWLDSGAEARLTNLTKSPNGMSWSPGFDPNKKYPLLLEIHGSPFANYASRFFAEIQLYHKLV